MRLFAVSRQVFAEAVKIFNEANFFSISTKSSLYLKAMPLFVGKSTGKEAPRPTNLTKKVHVCFTFITGTGALTNTDEFRFLWKRFCEFLQTCRSLRTVEISAQWLQVEARERDIELQFDRLTEILKKIRSTTGATFSEMKTDTEWKYYGTTVPSGHYWHERRVVGNIV